MKKLISLRLSESVLNRIYTMACYKNVSNTSIIETALEIYWHDYKYDLDHYGK